MCIYFICVDIVHVCIAYEHDSCLLLFRELPNLELCFLAWQSRKLPVSRPTTIENDKSNTRRHINNRLLLGLFFFLRLNEKVSLPKKRACEHVLLVKIYLISKMLDRVECTDARFQVARILHSDEQTQH